MSLIHPNRVVPPLTYERYADVLIPADGSYIPTTPGFYSIATVHDDLAGTEVEPQYYSTATGVWRCIHTVDYYRPVQGMLISDGANLRVLNPFPASKSLVMMRSGYSKPNPSPSIGRQVLYGKKCIVLESNEKGFIWIEEEDLTKLCENIFLEVREAKEKGEPHPLIGKTFILAIKEDTENKLGYAKYKELLRNLGFDV